MRYQGGKHTIARRLTEAILNNTDQRGDYYEPFIGGGSMAAQMGHHFDRAHYSDLHGPLILMWQAAHAGFIMHGDPGHFFPTDITRADYDYHKQHQPHSPATALIGFGSGFGGKYYGSYTEVDTRYSDGRTYHHAARNGLMKKIRGGASSPPNHNVHPPALRECDPSTRLGRLLRPALPRNRRVHPRRLRPRQVLGMVQNPSKARVQNLHQRIPRPRRLHLHLRSQKARHPKPS